jgi:micrococcal nuclease
VSIEDGDSFGVLRNGREIRIRLLGVDCPEGGQDFGQRAKAFTSDLIFNRIVELDVRDIDQYGRLVALVTIEGQDLGLALVKAGLGWHYTQYSKDPALATAERDARVEKRGLWAQPNPVAPWTYRKPVPARAVPAAPRLPLAALATAAVFHGNTDSKVFHAQGCVYYECKNCTVKLTSVDEARSRGFRPHRECVP